MENEPTNPVHISPKMNEEFVSNWEKNFESSLKTVKKFKEDMKARPKLTPTTESKFETYLNVLILEITETLEQFKGKK
jgi:hypothetical protein